MWILLYECTGNSLVGGPGFYRAIVDKIRETRKPANSCVTDVIEALKALGIKRCLLCLHYIEEVNDERGGFQGHRDRCDLYERYGY